MKGGVRTPDPPPPSGHAYVAAGGVTRHQNLFGVRFGPIWPDVLVSGLLRVINLYMKNEKWYFLLKTWLGIFWFVTMPLQWLVTSNLRHLDVVNAKTDLTPCGLDNVFVIKFLATRWCPNESTQCRSDEICVQLTKFLIIVYCMFGRIICCRILGCYLSKLLCHFLSLFLEFRANVVWS